MLCSACVLVMLGSSLKRSTRVGPSEYTVTYTCARKQASVSWSNSPPFYGVWTQWSTL